MSNFYMWAWVVTGISFLMLTVVSSKTATVLWTVVCIMAAETLVQYGRTIS